MDHHLRWSFLLRHGIIIRSQQQVGDVAPRRLAWMISCAHDVREWDSLWFPRGGQCFQHPRPYRSGFAGFVKKKPGRSVRQFHSIRRRVAVKGQDIASCSHLCLSIKSYLRAQFDTISALSLSAAGSNRGGAARDNDNFIESPLNTLE